MAKTLDLSTLELGFGLHEVKVKARAPGFRESNFSNVVAYDVNAGGEVTFNISEEKLSYKDSLTIYDGDNVTGTVLYQTGSEPAQSTLSLTCQTGNLFIVAEGSNVYITISGDLSGDIELLPSTDNTLLFRVTGDGSASIVIDYDD